MLRWFSKERITDPTLVALRARWRKAIRRIAVVSLGTAFIGILLVSGATLGNFFQTPDSAMPVVPITSYVHLSTIGHYVSVVEMCDPEEPDCVLPEMKSYKISAGSAVKISGNRLLSAGHVCEAAIEVQGAVGMMDIEGDVLVDSDFLAIDHLGQAHSVKILAIHAEPDLCILQAAGVAGEEAVISDSRPYAAEKVWNVASPQGIFTAGAPIILDGFFTGELDKSIGDQYTIPGAPGSSGSPVFRSDGTIVGIIHSVHPQFEHATYAATLASIQAIELVTRP